MTQEMGTKVEYLSITLGKGGGQHINFGYCKQPAEDVFKKLYQKYVIQSYERLSYPIDDCRDGIRGIIITSKLPPPGCEIIAATLDDLNLEKKCASYKIEQRIKDKSYFVANLRERILHYLGQDFVDYRANAPDGLNPSGERLNQKVRDYLTLLKIAGIVMGRKNPDAKLLQQIVNNHLLKQGGVK